MIIIPNNYYCNIQIPSNGSYLGGYVKTDIVKLEEAVKNSTSFRGAARYLGIKHHNHLKKQAIEFGIDFSHFTHGKAYDNLVGKKYNKLTVLEVLPKTYIPEHYSTNKLRRFCRCVCECGKECIKRIDSVKSNRVMSCGCAVIEKGRFIRGPNNGAFKGVGLISGTKFYEIKRGAKRRNIKFNLSKKYLWELFISQNEKCALTNQQLWFGRNSFPHETNASLDRIDSSVGYIKGNVQWVHKDINKVKGSLNQKYFIELCKMVAQQF